MNSLVSTSKLLYQKASNQYSIEKEQINASYDIIIIINQIFSMNSSENMPKTIQYFDHHTNEWKLAKSDICIHQILGDRIDLEWNYKGQLRIQKSQHQSFSYSKHQGKENFNFIKFRHGAQCPLLRQNVEKNPQRNMKPCACVLLIDENKKEFLVTQRSPKLLFPCAWVLPGGHLQPNQGVFEGGIRQCEEEVGLPKHKGKATLQHELMVWESVALVEQKVKATAIVVFFAATCEEFPVKMDESEVIDFKWKKIEQKEDEIPYDKEKKTGYAEGHRKYLTILRENKSF